MTFPRTPSKSSATRDCRRRMEAGVRVERTRSWCSHSAADLQSTGDTGPVPALYVLTLDARGTFRARGKGVLCIGSPLESLMGLVPVSVERRDQANPNTSAGRSRPSGQGGRNALIERSNERDTQHPRPSTWRERGYGRQDAPQRKGAVEAKVAEGPSAHNKTCRSTLTATVGV